MKENEKIVFDLLRNEHFVQWVQNPTQESNFFWTNWLSNHEDAKRDIEIARKIIQSGALRASKPLSDEAYGYMLENIMEYARTNGSQGYRPKLNYWRYIGIAAAFVGVLFSVIFLVDMNLDNSGESRKSQLVVKKAPNGSKLTTRLPDGTLVTLNSGSSISFPEFFDGPIREVEFQGEVFFDVERNPKKPFIIRFQNQEVEVLGTSFNIRAYIDEPTTQVSVASGKVSFSIDGGEKVILTPEEMGLFNKKTSTLEKGSFDKLEAFGWKDNILHFNSNSFEEIKERLERWYGISISGSDVIEIQKTYTETFENPSIREVLYGLSFIYRFDFTIEGSQVTIKKKPTEPIPK